LAPSRSRSFLTPDQAQTGDRIRAFATNLVIELIADEFGKLLTHNEVESIIQHYKILPWTNMIDLTLDVNVAKAFAALSSDLEVQPTLYQIVIWNLGLFDTGTELIYDLPFARPRLQSAVAHFGFGLELDTGRIIERYALFAAVTEHPLEPDGSGWERFGGPSFSIRSVHFPSPIMSSDDRVRLETLLYPPEPAGSLRVLERIVAVLERNLSAFPELGHRVGEVKASLQSVAKRP
jgi:hypothetical protein